MASFSFRKDTTTSRGSTNLKIPVGNPNELVIQPKGSIIYSPIDNFVYISDGANWDRVSGVNNPVDLSLPITQNRMAKWSDDFPPGGTYTTPVLQDSSLEVDNDGNAILNDTGNTPTSFPWLNGNFAAHGSVSTSYTFGASLDPTDPISFTPILTQLMGETTNSSLDRTVSSSIEISTPRRIKTKEIYDNGSVAIGHSAMEHIVHQGLDIKTSRNVAVGVGSSKHMSPQASDNVSIGWHSLSFPGVSTKRSVSIGSMANACSNGNVAIGFNSQDNGHANIIALGSDAQATGNNRIVIGSGVNPVCINNNDVISTSMYIPIQIGNDTYLLPLFKFKL